MDISHRKVKKQIQFIDAQGKPLANKEVKIQQTKHDFLFGCGAFDFIPYVLNGDDFHKQMTESWLEVFNYGTLPFYWGQFEKEEGKPNTETLMKTAQYLKSKNVTVYDLKRFRYIYIMPKHIEAVKVRFLDVFIKLQ